MANPRDFRPFLPTEKAPPVLNVSRKERTAQVIGTSPIKEIDQLWSELYAEPFKGLTTDGNVRSDLRKPQPNGAPVADMVAAAEALLAVMTQETRDRAIFPLEAGEWRRWHNMPLQFDRDGYSIEEMNDEERAGVLGLAKASLSPEGHRHLLDLMRINAFSGDLVGRQEYLNEWSFQFGLFGEPSLEQPWGWQLFGHHIAINCVVIGEQMVISPTFLAAEPSLIDEGPYAGTEVFLENEQLAQTFMRALSPALQVKAQVVASIMIDDTPLDMRHWADGLHLGGAFRDNRVVAYEGVCGAEMTAADHARLMRLIEAYFLILPDDPKRARLLEIEKNLSETYFCWKGAVDDVSPFYYRIQSPVVLIEFDHHDGVFLTNSEPARFHTHTITRIPNGGDYGMDLLTAHFAGRAR